MERSVIWACSALLCACGDGQYDAKTPGDPIGQFAITGALRRDDCEAAVLGVVDPWEFEVKLSRLGSDLYWLNGREAISGSISADRSFAFDARVDIALERSRAGRPGCTLSRRDRASGTLSPDAVTAATIEGEIAFRYEVRPGFDCSNAIGVPGGFARLPCEVRFDLAGERLDPPPE